VVLVDVAFEDVAVGGCVLLVDDLALVEDLVLVEDLLLVEGLVLVEETVLPLDIVVETETVPSTQYSWPTTNVGQLTPGFRASKFATVRPQELATESHVSPLLASTA